MKHVSQVNIASYRGLSDIEIGGLTDVNVFLGPSNSGKSSALEAMYLTLSAGDVGAALIGVMRSRGIAGVPSLSGLFPKLDRGTKIDIGLRAAHSEDVGIESQLPGESPDNIHLTVRQSTVNHAELQELMAQQGLNLGDNSHLDVEIRVKLAGRQSIYGSQMALNLKEVNVAGQFVISGDPPKNLENVSFVTPSELTDISVFDESYSNAYLHGTLPNLLDSLRSVYPLLGDIRPVKMDASR